MAKSADLTTHIAAIKTAIDTEMALVTADNQLVKDRPGMNVRDRIVKAIDAYVATADWSTLTD